MPHRIINDINDTVLRRVRYAVRMDRYKDNTIKAPVTAFVVIDDVVSVSVLHALLARGSVDECCFHHCNVHVRPGHGGGWLPCGRLHVARVHRIPLTLHALNRDSENHSINSLTHRRTGRLCRD